uniref:CSRNP_N domain-containing protein n=1 Tax=Panagrellus redivivus TaxID=6233 RepID=A0A7E4UN65_PANRE
MSVDSLMDVTNFEEQYTLPDDDEPSEELRAKREKFLLTRTLPVENSDDQPELVPRTTIPRRGRNLIKSFSASHSSSNESADVGPEAGPSQRTSRRLQEKKKKKVHFGEVHVFYFGRQQAYSVVPSKEGASLGMEDEHHDAKKYTFDGFTRARYRDNEKKWNKIKKYIQEQRKKPIPSEIRRSPRRTVTFAANLTTTKPPSIEYDALDAEIVVQQVVRSMVDAVAEGIEHEEKESSSDEEEVLPANRPVYLIPLEKHIRHALLSTANVQPDPTDFEDCKDIRDSRSKCGCSCTDGICDPATCECSLSGIKCQVDQDGFPCPCDELNCANKEGRVEFSPSRVRTHYLSTIKLLKDTEKVKFEPTSTLPRHIKFPNSDDESGTSTSYLATPPPPIYKTHKPDFVKSLSLDAVDVNLNPVHETVTTVVVEEKSDEAGANCEPPAPPPPTTVNVVEVAEVEKKKFPVTPTYKRERNASVSDFETPTKKVCEEVPEPTLVPFEEEEAESKEEFLFPTIESFLKSPPPPMKPAIRTSPRKRLETRTPTSTSIVVVGNVLQGTPQKPAKPTMPTARSVALNFSQTIDEDNESIS